MSAPSIPRLLVSHWSTAWTLDAQAAIYAAVYLWATTRLRMRWPIKRTAAFLAGIGTVLVALQSGIGSFDDVLLSVHMVQHTLLLLVVPVLLLAGRPTILALRTLPAPQRAWVARALAKTRGLTGPVPCLGAFYLVVVLTHLPSFYDATLREPALHDAEHALYLLTGLMMWWPLLDGDPAPAHRLGTLGRLVYLLLAMVPMAIVGAYLNRHTTLVYAPYGPPAHALGISALHDQAQAGAIMWVLGTVAMAAVGLWSAIAAMLDEERRLKAREARASAAIAQGGSQ